jgi:hypothetical protein
MDKGIGFPRNNVNSELIQCAYIQINLFIDITQEMSATAERGARFHPTVGSVTPNEFTTSHPRAETTMLRDCVSVCQ